MPANRVIEAYASAARTASPADFEVTRKSGDVGYFGAIITIDITAIAATPSVVFNIEGVDDLSGQTYTILSSAALTSVSTVVLQFGEGVTANANLAAEHFVPRRWRINPVHADADSITYSVSVEVLN